MRLDVTQPLMKPHRYDKKVTVRNIYAMKHKQVKLQLEMVKLMHAKCALKKCQMQQEEQ